METETAKYDHVSPGTAGLAQKISSGYKIKKESLKEERLYLLRPNKLMVCGQNQYS